MAMCKTCIHLIKSVCQNPKGPVFHHYVSECGFCGSYETTDPKIINYDEVSMKQDASVMPVKKRKRSA